VGTNNTRTWCELLPFCFLITPKQRGFTPKNGVIKKINSGNAHHLVNQIMFWYLHPLQTCEFVPISFKAYSIEGEFPTLFEYSL
jgi:hypothetical protein